MMRNSCVNVSAEGKNCWIEESSSAEVKTKKSAWTDLDQKYFEKIVKVSDVEIEKSVWTDLDQRHFEKNLQCSGCSHLLQASSTRISRQQDGSFVKTLRTWGPPKRLALRWPAFDKRCSSCYTLRRCVFTDIQTREEYRCSCKLEGNKVKNARPCSWLRLFRQVKYSCLLN